MKITKRTQTPESIKTLIIVLFGVIISVLVIIVLQILGFVPSSDRFAFISGLLAGIFGILIGFSLDRFSDEQKDSQTKDVFLKLIREELVETKKNIHPQTQEIYILYTEIWDSIISSGVIKLLTSEQVSKLSRVYKVIKGTSYEAERVRDAKEAYMLHGNPEARKDWGILTIAHSTRMEKTNALIDELLKENWLN